MSNHVYRYTISVVDNLDGSYTATFDGIDCQATAATPLLAVAGINEQIAAWANGGAERWMGTAAGKRLAAMFVRELT
jgi:hypothetical protein